ncbi:MAG: hypothetical protein K8R88_04310 [Armatimonadetes bacterium]|nr:hypothetical protein [Armatimonadota bacterium]
MSETAAVKSKFNFGTAGNAGFIIAALGFVGWGIGVATLGEAGWQSYMYGYICFATIVLGCFGMTMLHHVCRGSWGLSVLRIFEAGGGPAAIGALAVGFLPIAFKMHTFYHHWMDTHEVWKGPMKAWYLRQDTFLIRAAIYFVIWFLFAYLLRQSSLRQDKSNNKNEAQFRTNLSAGGLVMFMITVTFAMTDWVMSMDPHWFSSIFGPWFAVNGALMALTLVTYIVCRYRDEAPYKEILSSRVTTDLGNMCFAFTMFWAYFTLSQWLIIWSGNLPEFTRFYAARNLTAVEGQTPWLLIIGGLSVLCGFFIPWFALLAPRVKARPELLMRVVLFAFLIRFIDLFYNVVPFMRSTFVWSDAAALVAFAGLWMMVMGKQTEKASLYAEHDQRLMEAAHSHGH